MNHNRFGFGRIDFQVGPNDVVGPWCVQTRNAAGGRRLFIQGQRVLKDPTPGEAHMEINRVSKSARPNARHLGKLVVKRCTNHDRTELAIFWKSDFGSSNLIACSVAAWEL